MKLLLSLFLSLQIVTNFAFFEDVVRIPYTIKKKDALLADSVVALK
jgi:hypothetical protein